MLSSPLLKDKRLANNQNKKRAKLSNLEIRKRSFRMKILKVSIQILRKVMTLLMKTSTSRKKEATGRTKSILRPTKNGRKKILTMITG